MSNEEIGNQIQNHVCNINKFLIDFRLAVIDQYRMDLLITNELMGIQNQCEKLGVCYM